MKTQPKSKWATVVSQTMIFGKVKPDFLGVCECVWLGRMVRHYREELRGHLRAFDKHSESDETHHFILSLGPEEKVELLTTSPISSRQKLKLLIVHM